MSCAESSFWKVYWCWSLRSVRLIIQINQLQFWKLGLKAAELINLLIRRIDRFISFLPWYRDFLESSLTNPVLCKKYSKSMVIAGKSICILKSDETAVNKVTTGCSTFYGVAKSNTIIVIVYANTAHLIDVHNGFDVLRNDTSSHKQNRFPTSSNLTISIRIYINVIRSGSSENI